MGVLSPQQGRPMLKGDVWTSGTPLDKSRCIRPKSSGFEPSAMTNVNAVSDADLVSPEALQTRANISVIVFRLDTDPFVVASVLSDSSFDFGLSKSAKLMHGLL